MPDYDVKAIKKDLSKILDEKRYEHTIGVAHTAAALAMCYGEDVNKAYLAGLLHDCAKCYDEKKRNILCKKYNVCLTEFEAENPFLIHAKLGAAIAKEKYKITDESILSAIRYHTTGKENMTVFEKIIFSADYIEAGRKKIEGLDEIRSIIFRDLDEAVYYILKNTMAHLSDKKRPIDETSQAALEFYTNIHNNKKEAVVIGTKTNRKNSNRSNGRKKN
ncbi:MAG: bis(5'-nucleosyl)-tetraphosphatase (symmetrical) YqeK [Lachnospiraceae bacterium]